MKSEPELSQPVAQRGCGEIFVWVFLFVWGIGLSIAAQFMGWALGQGLFDGSLKLKDLRWAIQLGYALLLSVMPLIVALSAKGWLRQIGRAMLVMAALIVLLLPSHYVKMTSAHLIAVLQILALGIGGWLLRIGFSRKDAPKRKAGLSWAWLVGGLLLFPWLRGGALGSWVDTLLALGVGFSGAWFVSLLFVGFFTEPDRAVPQNQQRSGLKDGAIYCLLLSILLTGLGESGNQWLLSFSAVFLGLPAILLGRLVRQQAADEILAMTCLVGLGLAWPLMWVDADELAVIISSSTGELIQWALREAVWMALITLFIWLLGTIFYSKLQSLNLNRWMARGAALLVWLAVLLFYGVWGQPGFFGEKMLVILRDQADVSQAAQIKEPIQRRTQVYQTLTAHADQTQKALRERLTRFGIAYRPYYLVNAVEVSGGPLLRWWLTSQPEVDRVLDAPVLRPLKEAVPMASGADSAPAFPQWNLTQIGADRVWNELGVTGEGIVVGNSDTGEDGTHPELAQSYRGKSGGDDYNWYDPWAGSTSPNDSVGHGTHTLGSILGKKVGVAPGSTWIACVNLKRNLGNPALYLDCMQFMLAPFPQHGNPLSDGEPARGAHVLNNSWGCPWVEGCDTSAFLPAVQALRAAGVFVVVSAGNSGLGGCSTVTDPPAIYSEVFSVGALNAVGQLANFSSLGPVQVDGSNRLKPDLIAPGEGVLSAYPQSTYTSASGTSMAGPHVVGVVALMWSANPALIGNINETTKILKETADPYRGTLPQCVQSHDNPNDAVGYGVVNAYAAVKRALEEATLP